MKKLEGRIHRVFVPSLSMLPGLTTASCWESADCLSRYHSERVGHHNAVVYAFLTNLIALFLAVPHFSLSG